MDLGHKQFKVGGLAIIINANQNCNKHLIGHTVTVEQIVEPRDVHQFLKEHYGPDYKSTAPGTLIIVSGVQTGNDNGLNSPYRENYSPWGPENLMPIGDDDEWQKLFEHEGNPYLVEA